MKCVLLRKSCSLSNVAGTASKGYAVALTFFYTVSFNYYFAWILSCLVLYETHTTYKHLLIMLIYTLQHLVNVLLKRLLHSVLWQPTTLCFFFFSLCMSNAIHTQRQMHFHTPHMFYVHIVACMCSLYQPFLHLPELRVVQVLLFRGAHYCTGQNMQPEQRQVNKFLKHFSSTAQVPCAALGQICHGRNRV